MKPSKEMQKILDAMTAVHGLERITEIDDESLDRADLFCKMMEEKQKNNPSSQPTNANSMNAANGD